jgi:group II intron reverse transcriptase/maturase
MNNHVNKQNLESTNRQFPVNPVPRDNWDSYEPDLPQISGNKSPFTPSVEQPKSLTQNKNKHPGYDTRTFYTEERESIETRANKLNSHTKRNENTSHINYSIYHLLCDPFTFANAYTPISKNKGALTKGITQDAEVMNYFGEENTIEIAEKFRRRTFNWEPVRRVMIEKPGRKKKRPIDTPTQENRIAQEALRGILEAIYEPEFREFETLTEFRCSNYGFRPGKSTWHAANLLKKKGRGTTQVIEGDIVGAYNNVDHDILLAILKRRIKDKLFLQTIKELLESGIMYKGQYIHSLIGTPQGGIVSPLLFNIYMFEFDKFVWENFVYPTTINVKKAVNNPAYKSVQYRLTKLLTKMKELDSIEDKAKIRKEVKSILKERYKLPHSKPETLPDHAIYARYADDWVLLLSGSNERANIIKDQITIFLSTHLKMELDKDKTLVSRIDRGFPFLGFYIKSWDENQNKITYVLKDKKNKDQPTTRHQKRTTSRQITVYPDTSRIHANLLRNKFCKTPQLVPIARSAWTLLDEYEIVLKFRQVFEGLANYYRWTDGFYALNRISYILQYSCAKTLSYRQKSSVSKIFKKYGKNMTILREIHSPSGNKFKQVSFITHSEISRKFAQDPYTRPPSFAPYDPFKIVTYWRTKFKFYTHCCICGNDGGIHLHHINSLKSIQANKETDKFSYFRSCLNRLQIPVCPSCHLDITHGYYSDKSPVEFYDEFIAKL